MTEPQSQGQECTPRPPFKAAPPFFLPLLLLKPSVHLILLQFHLSPPEPPNRHPPPPLPPSRTVAHTHTHIPLCIFLAEFSPHFPSLNLTRSHLLLAASRPLGTPTAQSLRPPSVAFQGCVFHALVAGQAPGDFPRWGLKVGQEPVVWSDVRACGPGFVCAVCAVSLHIYASACVGVYSSNSLQKASCTNAALNERGVELTSHTRHPILLCCSTH